MVYRVWLVFMDLKDDIIKPNNH